MCREIYLKDFLKDFHAIPGFENEFNRFINNLRNSEIIVAFPGAFFFIGEHAVMYGQPALCMSIPLMYLLGLKRVR